ncbi:hypothetical protein WDZ92_32780, partial [Nostoc sp. NIES-2111]
ERKLSSSTLAKHANLLRKIFRYMADHEHINRIPPIPKFEQASNPRPYFDQSALARMIGLTERYSAFEQTFSYTYKGKPVRRLKFDSEFADFIFFALNSFVRLSDLKDLRVKHTKPEGQGTDNMYIELFPPHSKTVQRSSVTMQLAVRPYFSLLDRHSTIGLAGPDNYLFYPQYENRTYMMEVVRRLFDKVLVDSKTKKDKWGRSRTLYSLRHTALMNRFLYGDNIDIHLLAMNALTSVEMLEKFYLSHAASKMRLQELQSFRKP